MKVQVFLPAGLREVEERSGWFRTLDLLRFFVFGFELKIQYKDLPDLVEVVDLLRSMGIPYGIHLPNQFANNWLAGMQGPRELVKAVARICRSANAPQYVVLHGPSVEAGRTYTPYASDSFLYKGTMEDYAAALDRTVDMIRDLMGMGIPVRLENVSLSNQFLVDGKWVPPTHLDLRIGTLAIDILASVGATGCGIVVDIEHLVFALQTLVDLGDLEVADIRGQLGLLDADVYHIVGNGFETRELVTSPEGDVLIAEHSPIFPDDAATEEVLRYILRLRHGRGVTFVLESSGPADYYTDRPEDTLEISFRNLCIMLQNLLQR